MAERRKRRNRVLVEHKAMTIDTQTEKQRHRDRERERVCVRRALVSYRNVGDEQEQGTRL